MNKWFKRARNGAFGTALLVPLAASAQDSSGGLDVTGIVSSITATHSQITAVITAVGLALVIIVAWSLVRRAMGK